jgi:hypothetical protein
MKYRIHGVLADGSEDDFTVEADTIEEIRTVVMLKVAHMGMTDCWSEEIVE